MNTQEVKELEDFIDRRLGERDRRKRSILERWATPTSLSLLVGVIIWAISLQAAVKEQAGKISVLQEFAGKTEERHDDMSIQTERVVILLDNIERRITLSEEYAKSHIIDDQMWRERIIKLEQQK